MAGLASIVDAAEQCGGFAFPRESRDPGRCMSSASALPWAPACAGEQLFGEMDW